MLERLRLDEVREALRLLGVDAPAGRSTALRALRDAFAQFGFVRHQLEQAPPVARAAFLRLVHDGSAPVEDLLGRGWWGRGLLPEPLDWLQRRALVTVDDAGRVVVVREARDGYLAAGGAAVLEDEQPGASGVSRLTVEPAGAVVVCEDIDVLHRAVALERAELRLIAPTVAVSSRSPAAVVRALREAGLPLIEDLQVAASSSQPALPDRVEQAVGPQAIRTLLDRAVDEQRQVRIDYFASSRGGVATDRVVDPWTFVDDLLTGWCHLRTAERTFAVDRIGRARLLPSAITHHPEEE
ncbi:MAG TPA: WYL domain-containing protein [Euzebyales bacterium]|nr:WYL domain-containing protein [Euzebyales bacterium]